MRVVLSDQCFPLKLTTHQVLPPFTLNNAIHLHHQPWGQIQKRAKLTNEEIALIPFPNCKKKKNYRLPPGSYTSPDCSHWFSRPCLLLLSTSSASCLFLGLCLRCFPFSLNCSLPWKQRICSACHAKCPGHAENFLYYKTQKNLVQWEDVCIDLSPASSLIPVYFQKADTLELQGPQSQVSTGFGRERPFLNIHYQVIPPSLLLSNSRAPVVSLPTYCHQIISWYWSNLPP